MKSLPETDAVTVSMTYRHCFLSGIAYYSICNNFRQVDIFVIHGVPLCICPRKWR